MAVSRCNDLDSVIRWKRWFIINKIQNMMKKILVSNNGKYWWIMDIKRILFDSYKVAGPFFGRTSTNCFISSFIRNCRCAYGISDVADSWERSYSSCCIHRSAKRCMRKKNNHSTNLFMVIMNQLVINAHMIVFINLNIVWVGATTQVMVTNVSWDVSVFIDLAQICVKDNRFFL